MRKTYTKLPKDGPKIAYLAYNEEGELLFGESEQKDYEYPLSWIFFQPQRPLPGYLEVFSMATIDQTWVLTVPTQLIYKIYGHDWRQVYTKSEIAKNLLEIYLPDWTIYKYDKEFGERTNNNP